MLITHKITMDIQRFGIMPYLDVVCGDAYTRKLELTLFSGGAEWPVPDGVTAAVRYSRSDGHGGLYDTLPDGEAACTIKENVVTAILAPQVLSAPGFAKVSVALIKEEMILGLFPVGINVKANPAMEATKGESYYNYPSIGAINEAIGDLESRMEAMEQGGSGITNEEKALILSLFRNAAYTANMSETFTRLEALWDGSGEVPDEPDVPVVTLTSISATYSGGDVPVGTAVTDLAGIVVTAHYSDSTSKDVTDYTLSGTIAEGRNTITVSYGGMTTTFAVTGVAEEEPESGEPVYQLAQATTFSGNGSDAIDTGLKLMSTDDQLWSIVITTNNSAFGWSIQDILRCAPANNFELFRYGIAQNGKYRAEVCASGTNVNGIYEYNAVDAKAVLVRTSKTGVMVYYVKDGALASLMPTAQTSFVASENPLIIGGSFNGTVNDMAVYMRALTQDEIKEYLGVSA